MRKMFMLIFCSLMLVWSNMSSAANARLTVTESTLNRILDNTGIQSDSGIGQLYSSSVIPQSFEICEPIGFFSCPGLNMPEIGMDLGRIPLVACRSVGGGVSIIPVGEPVAYQWWINDVSLALTTGHLKLTATVLMNVDGYWHEKTDTVDVSIIFETEHHRLKLIPGDFVVPLTGERATVAMRDVRVNVSDIYTLSIPVYPQNFDVNLPDGGIRNITGNVKTITNVSFYPNVMKVDFDVEFKNN